MKRLLIYYLFALFTHISWANTIDCLPNETVSVTLKSHEVKCASWTVVAKSKGVQILKEETTSDMDKLLKTQLFQLSVDTPGVYKVEFHLLHSWDKKPIDTRIYTFHCYKTITKTINVTIGGRLVELKLPIDKPLPPGKIIHLKYGDEDISVQLTPP